MTTPIVQSHIFLTLLGGKKPDFCQIKQSLSRAPILVAADGGADIAREFGTDPAAVIGDMDSISRTARGALDSSTLHHIAEQDSTDFEKCLQRIEAPGILALGFTGGRLDHELAAMSVLVRYPEQRCILIGEEDLCCLAPKRLSLDLPIGTRLSLYPMGEVEGTSRGLKYPINGIRFRPDGRVGTSNEVTGPVELEFSTRKMLLILPLDHLDHLMETLGGSETQS